VLVVNVGSSSLKLSLFDDHDARIAAQNLPAGDHEQKLRGFLDSEPELDAIGHRVVHGGTDFHDSVVVTDEVLERLRATSELAPLHNPPAVRAIEELRRLVPDVPSVACFDTAFHATLPEEAALYALPERWQGPGVRRYGFHGLSYAYAARRAAELLGVDEPRPVICHLGAGASVAAVAGGRSLDTTMGFTPLEGLVMATRSGSVDPGLLLWLQRREDVSPDEMEDALEHESGLAGLTGGSGDMVELLAALDAGHARAKTALGVYVHRLRAAIAAMAAALDRLDALVFTGAVGEGSDRIRLAATRGLDTLLGVGVRSLDVPGGDDAEVTADGSRVRALVIHAREDLEILRQTRAALGRTA
jgi:acetate kinase